jgi:hypothetical protein
VPQLLDGGLRLYLRHFGLLFPVPLIAGLVTWIVEFTAKPVAVQTPALPAVFRALGGVHGLAPPPGAVLLALVVEVLASVLLLVMVARVATDAGEPSLGEAFGAALRCLWPVVAIGVVLAVCGGIGLVLFVVPGVFLLTRWAVAAAAAAVEGRHAGSALGRSWSLVRGHFWHTLGTVFFAGVVSWILVFVGTFVGLVFAAIPGRAGLEIRLLWQVGVNALVAPYAVSVFILLFSDLRARKEGTDLGGPALG